jgi:hypothetical protein
LFVGLLGRIYEYLAQGKWFRRVSGNGTFSLGGEVYYIGTKWQHHQLEVQFEATQKHFLCYDEPGNLIKQLAWKPDLPQQLIGNALPTRNLPSFQLHLPFTWDDIRRQHFLRETEDTTL